MALKKNKITLANTNADTVYIDEDNVIAQKRAIKNDLTNIINTIDKIGDRYKKLANLKSTKGTWQDVAKACYTASNAREKQLKSDKTNLENAIDDAIQAYALSQIKNLREAQAAANNIQ